VRRALRAEWTKVRTVPSTGWLVVAAAVATVAVGALATATLHVNHCPTPATCFEDTAKASLTGVWLAEVAVIVLAVLAVGGEYGTRMIQTTLTAQPRRPKVLIGKLVVVVGLTLAAGTTGVVGAVLTAGQILPGNGFSVANGYRPLSLTDGHTLRAAGGTVLYLALIAALSVGVAMVVRDTAGAVTAVLAILLLPSVIAAFISDPEWRRRLDRYSPSEAGLAIQATQGLADLPISPWAGLAVLAGYATVAVVAGAVVFQVRDA